MPLVLPDCQVDSEDCLLAVIEDPLPVEFGRSALALFVDLQRLFVSLQVLVFDRQVVITRQDHAIARLLHYFVLWLRCLPFFRPLNRQLSMFSGLLVPE